MKKEIHPKYHANGQVTCACGNSFTTGSTQEKIEIEVCSACHPFFTGKAKFVDTARRVEKFKEKEEKVKAKRTKAKHTSKKAKRVKKEAKRRKANKAGKKAAKEDKARKKDDN